MTTMPVTIQERIPIPAAITGRPGGGPPTSGLTPQEIFRILRQRLFLILTLWMLMSGGAVGLTYYLEKNYPSYEARTVVQVESPFVRVPGALTENPVTADLMNRYVQDQAVLMKDETVLGEALKDAQVRATGWYHDHKDRGQIVDDMKQDLTAAQLTGSSYLAVAFSARNAKDAASICNTIVDKYLYKVQEMSQLQYQGELDDTRKREKALYDRLQAILEDKMKFIALSLGTPGATEGLNLIAERLKALAAAMTKVEEEKLAAKSVYDSLTNVDPSRVTLSPQMLAMIQADPEINGLQQQKNGLEQYLVALLNRVGENHREVVAIKNKLEDLDKRYQVARLQKENEYRDYELNSASTQFQHKTSNELSLRESMLELEAKQRDLDQALARYRNMVEQQEILTKELDLVRQYSNQLELVIKDRGMVRVRKIGTATPPVKPSFPQWGLMVPGGSILGLMLGIGLALMLELMDTSMRTSRDVVRHVHVPILGTVPDLDDEEVPIEQIEMAAHTAPRSMTAEAFRTIRTNLLLSSPAERQRTVLVTSAKPEEGKTAIAVNLAISIGQSGRRVLLIDANFHRPALHQLFGKTQIEGLSNALIGQSRLEDLVRPTDLPNLDIVTTGPIPPNPTELLASPYLRDIILQAAHRYDQVIFDGPPVLLMSDAMVLTGAVDGVILVCRAKSSSRGVVMRAREQLERVNGRIFGAVLNAARVRRGGYFREQIRSYYDYQTDEGTNGQGQRALPNGTRDHEKTTV